MIRMAAVALALTLVPAAELVEASAPPEWQAIRPQSPSARRLYARALEYSPTVRALAARIHASDVIVYVELRNDLPAGMAAQLTWMSTTTAYRIVRVSIRHGLRQTDGVGFVAHELQHAVEIAEHPEVRSSRGLEDLYRRIGERGRPTTPHWDTDQAVAAERVARLEALGQRTTMTRRSG